MAMNSFVTSNRKEMGRAQAVQAEVTGTEACVDMNSILLKPESNPRCRVMVSGEPAMKLAAGDYERYPSKLFCSKKSLTRLGSPYAVVATGRTDSPAEI